MGITHPRPPMRSAEGRKVAAKLKRHTDLMLQFEAQGMSREEASKKAYEEIGRISFKSAGATRQR